MNLFNRIRKHLNLSSTMEGEDQGMRRQLTPATEGKEGIQK